MTTGMASAATIDFESALPAGVTLTNIFDSGTYGTLSSSSPRYIDFGGDVTFDSGDFWVSDSWPSGTTLILSGYNDVYTAGDEVFMLAYNINTTPTTYAGSALTIDRLYITAYAPLYLRLDNIVFSEAGAGPGPGPEPGPEPAVPAPSAIILAGIGTCLASWIRKRYMA